MKKWLTKTLLITTAGLTVIAGAGVGGYFIFKGQEVKAPHYYDYYNSKTENVEFGIPIKLNPISDKPEDKDSYFLSNKGLGKLKDKINKCLQYGPEFSDLDSINIDDQNIVNEDESTGAYVPSTDQINVNTKEWRDEGFKAVTNEELHDTQEDAKIELIFQIIFHEYGHFLANKYINSEPKQSLYTTIYGYISGEENGKDKERIISSNWNKNFYRDYKYLMGYDSTVLEDKDKNLTAAGIYQEVNNSDPKKLINTDKRVNSYDRYYYSMDELFTRKYQQIMMPLNNRMNRSIESSSGAWLMDTSWYSMPSFGQYNHASPYGQDKLKYIDIKTGKHIMADDPYENELQLYELFGEYVGFAFDNSITSIYPTTKGDLKIGGYFDFANFKEGDTIKLKIGANKLEEVQIHKLQPKLNNVINKTDTKGRLINGGNQRQKETYFWVSNNLNATSIIDKSISLVINGKEVPIEMKPKEYGTVTTYRSEQNVPKENLYHVISDKGIAKIEPGSGE